ncbi:hypothetical protein ScPMuIL_001802 [Solemya velum]
MWVCVDWLTACDMFCSGANHSQESIIMDFNEMKSVVETWLQTSSTPFHLLSSDDTERRFLFHIPNTDVSFFITCPEGKKEMRDMTVWTDSDKVIPYMSTIQDYTDSCRNNTLFELLQKISSVLNPLSDGVPDEGLDSDEDEGLEDDDGGYYMDEDVDANTEEIGSASKEEDPMDENFFMGDASPAATKRIFSDLKNLERNGGQFGISGSPRGDNLFVWDVQLKDFPDDTRLGKDLRKYATKHKREPVLQLEMQFPGDYPMSPPFVRLIRPRLAFLSGHVTIGGSICMEMLTKSGWRPCNDIESILVQVRSEIMSDPEARLDQCSDRAYGEQEARDAFNRMVHRYGWNK